MKVLGPWRSRCPDRYLVCIQSPLKVRSAFEPWLDGSALVRLTTEPAQSLLEYYEDNKSTNGGYKACAELITSPR
jgi:hypothetical protein